MNIAPIHVLGRAIFTSEDHILLSHKKGRDYSYLPGGHVEYQEAAATAILRELDEEFGGRANIGEHIATVEHTHRSWSGNPRHEISLVFAGMLVSHTFQNEPVAREEQLEFFWHPVDEIEKAHLLPAPMRTIVTEFVRHGRSGLFLSSIPR